MKRAKFCLMLEQLESREVPATYVNNSTISYQDADGDQVQIMFLPGFLPRNTTLLNTIFQFDQGSVNNSNDLPQQLQRLNLATLPGLPENASISFTVTAIGQSGNGKVDVGVIDMGSRSLKSLVVPGDLGSIQIGNYSVISTIDLIQVASIGMRGLSTQSPGGTLRSTIYGKVKQFYVEGDWKDASMIFSGNTLTVGDTSRILDNVPPEDAKAQAVVGTLFIGGSLIGGTGRDSARIQVFGTAETIQIGGDILGGSGDVSGKIVAAGATYVRIQGSVRGGAGLQSGQVLLGKGTSLQIEGSIIAGSGKQSGFVGYSRLPNAVIAGFLNSSLPSRKCPEFSGHDGVEGGFNQTVSVLV